MVKKTGLLQNETNRKINDELQEQRFRKYVPENLARCMTPRQKQLLTEEIQQAYRYRLPWHRRAYIQGLWHGIDLVERYFSYSDETQLEQTEEQEINEEQT